MLRTVSRIRNLPREREIAEVFAKHGMGFVLRRYALGRFLLRTRGVSHEDRLPTHWGDELRQILEELGPTYIKVGQILSVRPDVLPPEVLLTLRGLRDEVKPVPFDDIREVIEEDLGATIEELFDSFDEEVIGSASIGQVYVARHMGRKVAVKVQRPRARPQVEADLPVIADIAAVVKERSPDLPFDAVKLVDEIKAFLYAELDYLEEARNTQRIGEDFRGDARVVIPEVHWDRTSSRVLTTDFIDGTPLSKLEPTKYSWEDRRKLAILGAQISMTQVFEHGAFHGDAHPSNIIVISPEQYGLIDFGLIGQISDREMRILTDYMIHLVRQQPDRIVRDMRAMGMVFSRQHDDDIASATDGILRRYTGVTLAQVDTQRLVTELLDMVYRYRIKLPTKYFLILLAGENVERATELVDVVGRYPYQVADLLDDFHETLTELRKIEQMVDMFSGRAGKYFNRVAAAIFLSALIVGSSQVHIGPRIGDIPVFALMMFTTAFFLGLWLLFGLFRSGGL